MKLGLIGCGKMGKAFLRGALQTGVVEADAVQICTRREGAAQDLYREYGIKETQSLLDLVTKCNTLLVAVKPHDGPEVLRSLALWGASNHLIISVIAGKTLAELESLTHPGARLVRVMPNTPVMLGKGASAYCLSASCTPADEKMVKVLLEGTGMAVEVEEALMDGVTGLSGSGPAYMFTCLEALSDAGVREGLSRELSIKLAAQTMLGAASMVLETGIHPSLLREQVTSPGGTTIEGLAQLERCGVRYGLMEAVRASAAKARQMGKNQASLEESV